MKQFPYAQQIIWEDDVGQIEWVDTLCEIVWKSCSYVKIWADPYKFVGETKGGSITPCYTKLFITSNYTIDELYKEDGYRDWYREVLCCEICIS